MTRVRTRRRRFGSEAGFTMVEMLIATLIMVVITGAMFDLLNPASGMFNSQPEVSDMQQRMRVGIDSMQKDLVMAGAGTYVGASAGALYNFFAPVMPYRTGDISPDPPGVFRTNTISVLYVPPTPAQTTVNKAMGNGNSREIDVDAQVNCGSDKHDALCGFEDGMRVLIFEPGGAWDSMTITHVQDEALHLQHNGNLSSGYNSGNAVITQVAAHTYYLRENQTTKTYQLMHYDGYNTDIPVVDDVVKLEFQYFGDPEPPRLLPGKCLTAECPGPWTTYGPKPPALGVTGTGGWPAGENCAFAVQNGAHVPRLSVLNDGGISQARLTAPMLTDGPWCPNATAPNRYDADLLRIRRIRGIVRTQVSKPWMRGPAGALFTYAGTAKTADKQIPDQEIRFDVTPRNMNLGR
jgi:type II secretory pathway pseudopilin PulG